MKVSIEGHRFDTEKAKLHVQLYRLDDRSNQHTGDVYMSSKGMWYVYTPSQWANMHSWVLMSPEEILSEYDSYLTQEQKEEIAFEAELDWE
jgi:hypothetical protein